MATKKNNSLEEKVEKKAERFEKIVDASADGFKRSTITWLRTSQFFDGMVNTPARILINTLSVGVLYVWGLLVFATKNDLLPWAITLLVLLFMQAASVRFTFSFEGAADELQRQRRERAYRKAYLAIRRNIVFAALVVIALVAIGNDTGYRWSSFWLENGGTFYMDNYRALVLALFVIAMITFQKYFAYGMKGEPFTIREKNNIKD
jgi:hypothetical protein